MIERGIITVKELKEKIYKIEGIKVSIEVPDFMHCKDYDFEPLDDDATVDDLYNRLDNCFDGIKVILTNRRYFYD